MKMLSERSIKKMAGVHPDLVRVVHRARAMSEVDFEVTEGLRTAARQAKLVEIGASKTLNSRHITGHAVDVVAMVDFDGDGDLDERWDWPLYSKIAAAMKAAATVEKVQIVWGGDWRKLKDGPHFELDRAVYA